MTFDFWMGDLEILKAAGMDWVMLDLEHGSAGFGVAEELCRVARLLDFPLLIRPEGSIYHTLRRYMDMGSSGFVIPWTERQEQVDTLESAVFCPPLGKHGPGGPLILATSTLNREGWD